MLGRELVQRLASQSASGAVQRQLRLGNADLANANLAKEGEIAELRNQIAIIRCPEKPHCSAARCTSQCWRVARVTRPAQRHFMEA